MSVVKSFNSIVWPRPFLEWPKLKCHLGHWGIISGIVPKKDPSEFRLIHYLSYPPALLLIISFPRNVRQFIMRRSSMPYLSSNGKGLVVLWRKQMSSAFRIIPIHPNDFALLGMKWQNAYYFDRCLPMGCSSSCAIFEAFSTALEWLAMNRLGASGVLLILDDFLFIADSHDKCHADLTNFLACASTSVCQ